MFYWLSMKKIVKHVVMSVNKLKWRGQPIASTKWDLKGYYNDFVESLPKDIDIKLLILGRFIKYSYFIALSHLSLQKQQ